MGITRLLLHSSMRNIRVQSGFLLIVFVSSLMLSTMGLFSNSTVYAMIQDIEDSALVDITIDYIGHNGGYSSKTMDMATVQLLQIRNIRWGQILGRIDCYSTTNILPEIHFKTRLVYTTISSPLHDDIKLVEGRLPLASNETLVDASSMLGKNVSLNDNITIDLAPFTDELLNISMTVVGKAIIGDKTNRIVNGTYSPVEITTSQEISQYNGASLIFCDWSLTMGMILDNLMSRQIYIPEPAQVFILLDRSNLATTQVELMIEQLKSIRREVADSAIKVLGEGFSWHHVCPILQEALENRKGEILDVSNYIANTTISMVIASLVMIIIADRICRISDG